MKATKSIILIVLVLFLTLQFTNCKKEKDVQSLREQLTDYLINKENGWTLKSISVPSSSATAEDHWSAFSIVVNPTRMTTKGHPKGAEIVWPSGGWTMDEEGKAITRADGVLMNVMNLTATSFKVSFALPSGTTVNGRTAALEGNYVFELE